jgi:ATP-dependent Lon protease
MKRYPFMSVRDLIVFPGQVYPLQVGRKFSLSSIAAALNTHSNKIVIVAQKTLEQSEKPNYSDVFHVGTLCSIIDQVKFHDGSMKILVKGEERMEVFGIEDDSEVRFCTAKPMKSAFSKLPLPERDRLFSIVESKKDSLSTEVLKNLESSSRDENAFDFLMGLGYLLVARSIKINEPTISQIKKGVFAVDSLSDSERKSINLSLSRIQEILESNDAKTALQKIEALI